MRLCYKKEKLNEMKTFYLTPLFWGWVFLCISLQTRAQTSDLSHWYSYVGNHKVGTSTNVMAEMHYRSYDWLIDVQQFVFRGGYGYNLTPTNNNVLLGYTYVYNEIYPALNIDKKRGVEHRLFQQFLTKQELFSVQLSHRYRIEERFFSDQFKMRFRYMLAMNVPFALFHSQAELWSATLNQEIYLEDNAQLLERFRWYGGVGYQLHPHLKVELGFMRQFQEKGNRSHVLLSFAHQINFSKEIDE